MIQATGTLNLKNGLQSLNPLINVYVSNISKFNEVCGIAQIGHIKEIIVEEAIEATEIIEAKEAVIVLQFEPIVNIATYTTVNLNPSFATIQDEVLIGLQTDYPTVNFEIV